MAFAEPDSTTCGECPVCKYPVYLGAANRVLAHNRVSRNGNITGRCAGRGSRVAPFEKKKAIYRRLYTRPRGKEVCECCGQEIRRVR